MNSTRLSRYCAAMAYVTVLGIGAMLLLDILFWLFPKAILDSGLTVTVDTVRGFYGSSEFNLPSLPLWQRAGGAVLSCIPLLILAQGLNALRRLFKLYATREYFTDRSASLLSKVGSRVALWVLADLVSQPLISVWLTMMRPEGQRLISVSFHTENLESLFIAAVVMIIARIQREGIALACENKQFI